MIRNLFLIAIRNLRKEKIYSIINITGLTLGITSSVLLFLYILNELSYDRYHKNAQNIYRVVSNIQEPDNAFTWAVAQIPLADELRDNYPEVVNTVRFFGMGKQLYKQGENEFYESDIYRADSTVFDMFSYRFLYGDAETALDKPSSIVLTRSLAIKYFGLEDAVGKSLNNQEGEPLQVTAVIADVPHNSHFRFDALISRPTNSPGGGWGNFGVFTYLQLPDGYDLEKMNESLAKVIKDKVDPIFEQYGIRIQYELQPITAIHLHSKIQDEAEGGGDISYIYIFAAVAAFMLVIACINYMNLATARSANRSKEVGIRKVMGSMRVQLIWQFILESVILTVLALLLSLILLYTLLPLFNTVANKEMSYRDITSPEVLLVLTGIVLIVGILGGSYPAFYLSGFNPVRVLKGKLASKGGSALFRKVLVVVQFSISVFMLISTLVVYDQLQYIRQKDLGFDKERVLRIQMTSDEQRSRAQVLAQRMRTVPVVVSSGTSNSSPGEGIGKLLIQVEDNEGKLSERGVDLYSADHDFVSTMGMKIIAGRDFSRDVPSDTTYGALVNEAMVRRMSWADPIGKRFVFGNNTDQNGNPIERRVVGVVKDYHQNSLYDIIEPLMILLNTRNPYVFVRLKPGDVKESIAAVERVWREVNPGFPMEYDFLDQDFDSQYSADQRRGQLFTAFSGLTIVIACLGLLGLAAFTAEQRNKEIGIRKIVGASVQGLVALVSREFLMLVMIGLVIALPVAWYFTGRWLENFSYHIELHREWPVFITSAIITVCITLLTIGYHIIRVSMANPVNALRDE